MALNKVINDANQKFEPVTTETLVFDTVPTVNSFNAITSDGVARAIAGASGEVPAVTESDNGKVLTAVYDAGGAAVEWAEAPSGLPDTTGASQGDVLTIGSSGAEWAAVPSELPASLGTAGQVLTVNAGVTGVEWATPSSGGGNVFVATYGTTTYSDVQTAYNAGKILFVKASHGAVMGVFTMYAGLNTFVFYMMNLNEDQNTVDFIKMTLDNSDNWNSVTGTASVTIA